MSMSWIVGALSIVSLIASVVTAFVVVQQRQNVFDRDLTREEKDFKEGLGKIEVYAKGELNRLSAQLESANRDLSQALHMIKLLSGEQALVNKVTAGTLSSLVDKTDNNESKIHNLEKAVVIIETKLTKWQ